MKRTICVILALMFVTCAHAQTQTKNYVEGLVTSLIPDNDAYLVSPLSVRTVLNAIIVAMCSIGDAANCPASAIAGGGGGGGGGSYTGPLSGLAAAIPSPVEGTSFAYITDAVSCVFGAGVTGGATPSLVPGCPIQYAGSSFGWVAY